jgi:phage tail-like protein
MPTVVNNRSSLTTDPLRNFRFLVEIKPHKIVGNTLDYGPSRDVTFGFTSVSGLSVTTESIPYREGGYNTTVHQIPGQTTFAPISLQRGVTLGTSDNWNWMRQLFHVVQGGTSSLITDDFRADVEIRVLSHPIAHAAPEDVNQTTSGDHVAMRFNVYNAWITSVAYSDLNAGDNAIFVEQMNLVHEGFDLSWAPSLTQSAAPADTPTAAAANPIRNKKPPVNPKLRNRLASPKR